MTILHLTHGTAVHSHDDQTNCDNKEDMVNLFHAMVYIYTFSVAGAQTNLNTEI